MEQKLLSIYNSLLKKHGYQGWWPINSRYHPKDYEHPYTQEEIFEISMGAILTQNTSWKNVEKAINSLKENNLSSPKKILDAPIDMLAETIKSSGYYNQKAKKLKKFAKFFLENENKTPSRDSLLEIWGIGKETADSILLYAYKQPYFVIDNYTKRIFNKFLNLNIEPYDEWQNLFHKSLQKDYKIFNEFHALIVAEGKTQRYR